MFENIQFQSMNFDRSVEPSASPNVFGPIFTHLGDYGSYFSEEEQTLDFNIAGKSYNVFPRPISNFAQDCLLYIQMFSLIDAEKSYYTVRKDYPSYQLVYTYEGCGILEYEGNRFELPPETGFWIDCRKPHRYYTAGDRWYHSVLHFDGVTAQWLYEKHYTGASPLFHPGNTGAYQKKIEKTVAAYQEVSLYREYEVSNRLNDLLLYLAKEKNRAILNVPDHIRSLQKYLEENYTKQMMLDEISRIVGISKYHMEREFKKYTGYSVTAYLIELRITNAKNLLDNTNLAVGIVSQLSGFSCYANFLRLFKQSTGKTPAEYRKNRG